MSRNGNVKISILQGKSSKIRRGACAARVGLTEWMAPAVGLGGRRKAPQPLLIYHSRPYGFPQGWRTECKSASAYPQRQDLFTNDIIHDTYVLIEKLYSIDSEKRTYGRSIRFCNGSRRRCAFQRGKWKWDRRREWRLFTQHAPLYYPGIVGGTAYERLRHQIGV